MFQFTTTNVINSKTDLTSGKALWQTGTDSLNILRVNNFKKDNVQAIYKAAAKDPELAKVTINLTKVAGTTGETYRLATYIGLSQASQDSRYSNDMIFKGKPFTVEFVWLADAAATAAKLVKNIEKYQLTVYGEKLLNVTANTSFITIEAVDEYQRFRKVNVEKFDADAHFSMGEYTVVRSLEDLTKAATNAAVTTDAEGYFVGKEGFGTYSYLLHNLRLPTSARTAAFAINQDETPIVGAKYTQFTIHYCVERGPLGMNAVGDTVKSVTTHVFYVKDDLATEFETALATIGTVTEA